MFEFEFFVYRRQFPIVLFQIGPRPLQPTVQNNSGAVVKAACLESWRLQVRAPLRPLSLKKNKIFLTRSPVMIQYCGGLS